MKRILWLSNHPINADQWTDLYHIFGKDCLVDELPPEGKKLWGNVPPQADFYDVECLMSKAFRTVHTGNFSDYDAIVVMGELSLCLAVMKEAVGSGVEVYTPTTERKSVEEVQLDGSVVKRNVFKHCQLRCLHMPPVYNSTYNVI